MRSSAALAIIFAPSVVSFPMVNGRSKADKNLENIFAQNKVWKESKLEKDPNFFSNLGSGHSPSYLWIGCADARVPANEVMGEEEGSVFVVRNVANMVVNTDFNLMSALQFAVDYLKIPHIIVCGHYDCGGIRASMEATDHVPPLENWLRNIRDVYRIHRKELNAIKDAEARHRRLVELNVIEQCINLCKTGAVQRRRVETFKAGHPYTTPRIHACVFDPHTGLLEKLDVRIVTLEFMFAKSLLT
jgi:carbonic anhydrase